MSDVAGWLRGGGPGGGGAPPHVAAVAGGHNLLDGLTPLLCPPALLPSPQEGGLPPVELTAAEAAVLDELAEVRCCTAPPSPAAPPSQHARR